MLPKKWWCCAELVYLLSCCDHCRSLRLPYWCWKVPDTTDKPSEAWATLGPIKDYQENLPKYAYFYYALSLSKILLFSRSCAGSGSLEAIRRQCNVSAASALQVSSVQDLSQIMPHRASLKGASNCSRYSEIAAERSYSFRLAFVASWSPLESKGWMQLSMNLNNKQAKMWSTLQASSYLWEGSICDWLTLWWLSCVANTA